MPKNELFRIISSRESLESGKLEVPVDKNALRTLLTNVGEFGIKHPDIDILLDVFSRADVEQIRAVIDNEDPKEYKEVLLLDERTGEELHKISARSFKFLTYIIYGSDHILPERIQEEMRKGNAIILKEEKPLFVGLTKKRIHKMQAVSEVEDLEEGSKEILEQVANALITRNQVRIKPLMEQSGGITGVNFVGFGNLSIMDFMLTIIRLYNDRPRSIDKKGIIDQLEKGKDVVLIQPEVFYSNF